MPQNQPAKKIPKVSWKIILLILIIVSGMLISYNKESFIHELEEHPRLWKIYSHLNHQIENKTYLGLIYGGILAGIFFLMIPIELFFFLYINLDKNPFLVTVVTIFSFMVGLFISYFMGYVLGKAILNVILTDKYDRFSDIIEKYGALFLFVAILFFLPVPLIVFVMGAMHYSSRKLYYILFFGLAIKFSLLYFGMLFFADVMSKIVGFM